jgi:hypothetical protein
MKNEAPIGPDPHAARRQRARWIVLGLVVGYMPTNLAVERWLPRVSSAVWYLYMVALALAWWFSLRIDWPRRNFQVREPDPPPRKRDGS